MKGKLADFPTRSAHRGRATQLDLKRHRVDPCARSCNDIGCKRRGRVERCSTDDALSFLAGRANSRDRRLLVPPFEQAQIGLVCYALRLLRNMEVEFHLAVIGASSFEECFPPLMHSLSDPLRADVIRPDDRDDAFQVQRIERLVAAGARRLGCIALAPIIAP